MFLGILGGWLRAWRRSPSARPSYRRLDSSTSQFRVLEFSGSHHQPTYDLRTVSLDSPPVYIALSYVWGDTSQTQDIVVDGQKMPVTVNLASALHHIRGSKYFALLQRPVYIWVDALCINQQSIAERNAQVRIMGRIYSEAAFVISWLGPDARGDMVYAARAIRVIAKRMKEHPDDLKWMGDYLWLIEQDGDGKQPREAAGRREGESDGARPSGISDPFTKTDTDDEANVLSVFEHFLHDQKSRGTTNLSQRAPGMDPAPSFADTQRIANLIPNKHWRAIYLLLSNPYWQRIWVLQEMVLAKHRIIMVGANVLSESALPPILALQKLITPVDVCLPDLFDRRLREMLQATFLAFQPGYIIDIVRKYQLVKNSSMPDGQTPWGVLYTSVANTANFLATDGRDKVFALLSMTDSPVMPDYGKSREVVYTELAVEYTKTAGRLDVLLLSGLLPPGEAGPSGTSTDDKLPSWVPDWEAISQGRVSLHWWGHNCKADEGLGGLTPSTLGVRDDKVLICHGCVCFTVTEVTPLEIFVGSKVLVEFVLRNKGGVDAKHPTGIEQLRAVLETIIPPFGICANPRLEPDSLEYQSILVTTLATLAGSEAGRPYNSGTATRLRQLGLMDPQLDIPSLLRVLLPGVSVPERWADEDQVQMAWEVWVPRLSTQFGVNADQFRLFSSEERYIGWLPRAAAPGDLVCVLRGGISPVVLRRLGEHFLHLGPCLVLGFMEGEAASKLSSGELEAREFEIV